MKSAISKFSTLLTAVLLVWLLVSSQLVAAESGDDEDKRQLPKSGVLSGGYIGGFEGAEIEGPAGFQDQDIFSEDKAPITGSVSKRDNSYWTMRVFNNDDEDTYSVSLTVEQVDKRNNRIRSDNYSYTLKPQEDASRLIRSRSNTANMILRLNSWRIVGGKKKVEEEATE